MKPKILNNVLVSEEEAKEIIEKDKENNTRIKDLEEDKEVTKILNEEKAKLAKIIDKPDFHSDRKLTNEEATTLRTLIVNLRKKIEFEAKYGKN